MSQPRQQVNLYQNTAPAWRPFGSATLALACGAVGCCLAVIWAFGTLQVARLRQSVDALQRQQAAQQASLSALGSLQTDGANPGDLQARVQQLGTELAAREHALALLQSGAAGSTRGFSTRLAALARHPAAGLWLQQITVSNLTGSMSLAGEVVDPDTVPRYLHVLSTEPVLTGLRFDRLVIERPGTAATAASSTDATSAAATPARPPRHTPAFKFHADGTAAPAQLAANQAPQS